MRKKKGRKPEVRLAKMVMASFVFVPQPRKG
jgi:hypothetical protein